MLGHKPDQGTRTAITIVRRPRKQARVHDRPNNKKITSAIRHPIPTFCPIDLCGPAGEPDGSPYGA